MIDSDQTAELKTVTGWVDRNGRFWGKDERMARYSGATHATCKCGNLMEKHYTSCQTCRNKKRDEVFNSYPSVEWDGKTPLCLFDSDEYFWDDGEVYDYAEENDMDVSELRLCLCEPNHLSEIPEDYFADDMFPEDWDGELPGELQKKIDELNDYIKTLPAISWSPAKKRVEFTTPEN